ncbi:hypothetical protein D3C87_1827000 [compost metagenome]
MHRPYATAHDGRRGRQPGQSRRALTAAHLPEEIQSRPGREDGDKEGQAVENGNAV